jgi:hypothetical protein
MSSNKRKHVLFGATMVRERVVKFPHQWRAASRCWLLFQRAQFKNLLFRLSINCFKRRLLDTCQ